MERRCTTCGIRFDNGVCHCPETAFAAIEKLTTQLAERDRDIKRQRDDGKRFHEMVEDDDFWISLEFVGTVPQRYAEIILKMVRQRLRSIDAAQGAGES